jgi:hypothetical protein
MATARYFPKVLDSSRPTTARLRVADSQPATAPGSGSQPVRATVKGWATATATGWAKAMAKAKVKD